MPMKCGKNIGSPTRNNNSSPTFNMKQVLIGAIMCKVYVLPDLTVLSLAFLLPRADVTSKEKGPNLDLRPVCHRQNWDQPRFTSATLAKALAQLTFHSLHWRSWCVYLLLWPVYHTIRETETERQEDGLPQSESRKGGSCQKVEQGVYKQTLWKVFAVWSVWHLIDLNWVQDVVWSWL